ncbi:hypothetical protein CCACVL1_06210 [Corchorus capsularis]|uniref:Uncharacterized protein n=1 Tax=Corchorus capsularis TaxID=210143 RepID=A0A1R3JGU4_COCAP|nr:hypothetical protein CCACVL1_06210 [Corchorus capsularis]
MTRSSKVGKKRAWEPGEPKVIVFLSATVRADIACINGSAARLKENQEKRKFRLESIKSNDSTNQG